MLRFTSQSTGATVRRSRRKERRANSKPRPAVQNSDVRPISSSKRSRRYNRDQNSYDVDWCFNICQDRGFHRDPDVRLGSEVSSNVNQFVVLEQDASCPSLPKDSLPHNFTFRYPTASSSLTPDTATPSAWQPFATSQSSSSNFVFRRSQQAALTTVDCPLASVSPLLPSIPTTPKAEPRIKLPETSPQDISRVFITPTSTSDYLDGIKIPSPLLYHKRSLELLERSSDGDINEELTKTFLLKCGRDVPEPDFESYKNFDKETTNPTTPETFITAAMPRMGSRTIDSDCIRIIPLAPWIEQSPCSIPELSCRPPTCSVPIQGSPRRQSDSNTTVVKSEIPTSEVPKLTYSDLPRIDLDFPKLPTSGMSQQDLEQTSISKSPRRTTSKPALIDEDLNTVLRRWAAFEEAIQRPRFLDTGFGTANLSMKTSSSNSNTVALAKGAIVESNPTTLDEVASSPSACTALVPARLYELPFLGWPKRLHPQPGYQAAAYPILCAPPTRVSDEGKVMNMVGSLDKLGFKKRSAFRNTVPDDVKSSLDEDFRVTFKEEPPLDPSSAPRSHSGRAQSTDDEDEGYCTCRDSGSELLVDNGPCSEDSWADWYWETEDEEDGGVGISKV